MLAPLTPFGLSCAGFFQMHLLVHLWYLRYLGYLW
jgi:hypothetical protein